MKKGALISLCMFILFTPSSLLADEGDQLRSLMAAKSLKCTFEDGFLMDWGNGELSSKKIAMSPITYDSINFKSGKSRMIARLGAVDVTVNLTLGGAHFIETTKSGTMAITTVFAVYGEKGEEYFQKELFYAVHSRHVSALFTRPLVSQYPGKCELLK